MTGLGNMDDVYKHYLKVIDENKMLEKKLDIAVKVLEKIGKVNTNRAIDSFAQCQIIAEGALEKIKEKTNVIFRRTFARVQKRG